MNLSEYQRAVAQTCATAHTGEAETLKLALVGLQDELGEIAGLLKKYLWYGHGLDRNHLQEEIGDLLWYVTTLCNLLGFSLPEAMQMNHEKLCHRHPDGFSQERSHLHWHKPRSIFVNSMSDLFHRDVPTEFIVQVFATMTAASWHTYQVLTKRPARLHRLIPLLLEQCGGVWPWHIWCGVSVEAAAYLWRVETLRRVPSPVRFISAEPLLEPLVPGLVLDGIAWVITGGESGAGHRLCAVQWVREVRDLCQQQGVAFFHKQWGGRTPGAGGRLLDGRTWDEFPQQRERVADRTGAVL